MDVKVAIKKVMVGLTLIVYFSDGSIETYDAIELGCEWFKMSNDAFYDLYGFSFTPHEVGLYEYCRKLVFCE